MIGAYEIIFTSSRVSRIAVYNLFTLSLSKFGAGFAELTAMPLLFAALEDLRLPEPKSSMIIPTLHGANTSKVLNQSGLFLTQYYNAIFPLLPSS